ncbi:gag-pol polyprotein [Cucumis melo var. makuwa]|uniref:Gag-pol polyprotein n=1 Tax=Cucumis melo var. makuwa TaxID=1194695 RepID=A0A5D3C743_CUCMM|nr:gag-pol polyprotein [Cucumis melo var. makuwa]TYK07160.1 gag-pol polyprotein [Cucumis melo var. makuwa]
MMAEDESIVVFDVRVLDLENESLALGGNISNTKLVRKVLRSLPSCFSMKVVVIEEANDITTMKLDELFGSLRTFELILEDGKPKKKSGIALQVINDNTPQLSKERIHDDNLAKSRALLTKQVSKLRSQFHKRSSNYRTLSNREFNHSHILGSSSFSSYAAHKHKDIDKSKRNSEG